MLSKRSDEFLKLHTEIGVIAGYDYYIYDIATPFVDGKPNVHKIADDSEEFLKLSRYQIPIFMSDASVICGDVHKNVDFNNVFNENRKTLIERKKSITMECITPILSFMGEPTMEKIETLLRPYLEFFGLSKRHCFITNHTAGCHVNISVLDTVKNEVLPIIEPPLFFNILDTFMEKEKTLYYSRFRSRQPYSAVPMPPKNYEWAFPAFKIHQKIMENPTIADDKKDDALLRAFMTKKHALKRKWNNILEFRVFQTERDIPLLLENTLLACDIVKDGILKSTAGGGGAGTGTDRLKNDGFQHSSMSFKNAKTVRLRNTTCRRRKRRNH
jgi:hypothetical protein